MLRKLAFALLATGLLAGCATDMYSYRAGHGGDYYYGQPRTEVRVYGYGGYYHGPYAYPYYRYGPYRYYGPYDPYWYGWYGYPGYYPYPYPHPHPRPRPDPRPDSGNDDDKGGPWRNLDEFRRRGITRNPPPTPSQPMPMPRPRTEAPPPRPPRVEAPRPRTEARGSRMEQTIRRMERDRDRSSEP